jgi:hypothetical protein
MRVCWRLNPVREMKVTAGNLLKDAPATDHVEVYFSRFEYEHKG